MYHCHCKGREKVLRWRKILRYGVQGTMEFAKRMERFETGIFSKLLDLKSARLAAGGTVVDMSIGAPNLAPAEHVMRALADAAMDPKNYIYAIQDLNELHQAVAAWYQRRYGVTLDPAAQITSLLGSQEGLAHIALTLADEGDVVLVPDPCYPVFADGPKLAGAELHYMPMKPEKDFVIDLRDIPTEVLIRLSRFYNVSVDYILGLTQNPKQNK